MTTRRLESCVVAVLVAACTADPAGGGSSTGSGTVADGGESGTGTGSGTGDADTTTGVDATDGMDATDDTDTRPTTDATDDATSTGPECTGAPDCGGTTRFCDPEGTCVACDGLADPDVACADVDPSNPLCVAGACVQCTANEASVCDDETPVCDTATNTCTGCTEHEQCPDSACHLAMESKGSCFSPAEVYEVTNEAELASALDDIVLTSNLVIQFSGATFYSEQIGVAAGQEIALLGLDSTVLQNTLQPSISVSGSGAAYVSNIMLAGHDDTEAVRCAGGTVWLDDSEVRNNAQLGLDISGGCAAHLRRTVVAINSAGGIDISGGQLQLLNAAVGLNGGQFSSTVGGIAADGTVLDIRYSTLAGNTALDATRGTLFCISGVSGEIRNSILVGVGNTISGCGALTFDGNAADEVLGGTNENVGAVMPTWFANLGSNDFRLTATGDTVFADIAQWEDGDPLTDIDGDEIPTAMPSHPGYDQP